MIQFWAENRKIFLILFGILLVWRAISAVLIALGEYLVIKNPLYFGPISLANFDGVHYLNIAQNGYSYSQQAFFPLFPVLIKITNFLTDNYLIASLIVVYVSFFVALFLFFKLSRLDYSYKASVWSVFFFIFFPTSFFLGNIYSESLFLALLLGSFYAARKKYWVIAGILGGLASATRLIGIFILPALFLEWLIQKKGMSKKDLYAQFKTNMLSFLLIPLGLISYMVYLWGKYGDALLFVHSQSNFGANRTDGELVFIHQVLYRYVKIFFSIPPQQLVFWVAVLEFLMFTAVLLLLVIYRKKIRLSYLLFSVLAIILPTLSGTLSSEPRYVLVAFPLYMILGNIKSSTIKIFLLVIFFFLFSVLIVHFTRGHFIA